MSIQKGEAIPEARVFELDAQGTAHAVSAAQRFAGKRIVLFAVPGAFTRTCSQVHLPSFVQQADALKAKGVDEIVCLAVNDVNVLAAWAREYGATGKISMVSDGLAEFSRAIGLDQDLSERGLGIRSKRYAMIIEDGKVKDIQVEPPGACEISKGEAVLQRLGS
jgi:peroxiredoxin